MVASLRRYLSSLADHFGARFCVVLVSVYTLAVGVNSELIKTGALATFKRLSIPAEKYQELYIIVWTPWTMKCLIGLLSDSLPIFGYHKQPYIVVTTVLGAAAMLWISLMRLTLASIPLFVGLLVVFSLHAAVADLLTEAKYSEMLIAAPHTGADIVSFKHTLLAAGYAAGALVAGLLADRGYFQTIFLLGVPCSLQLLVPILLRWFPEKRASNLRPRYVVLNDLARHAAIVKVIPVVLLAAALVGGAASALPQTVQFAIALSAVATLCVASYLLLPSLMFRVNVYLLLQASLRVSLTGVMDYWFTADRSCVSDGPNFSYTFYSGVSTIVTYTSSIVAIMLFQRFLSSCSYRSALSITLLLKLASAVFDFAIVLRWNVRLGISDEVTFLLGDVVISRAVSTLTVIPMSVLTSKVCPSGVESTVFALLVSYENLGWVVARVLGNQVVEWLRIKSVGQCDFSNLPKAMLVAYVLGPLLIFPLVYWIIPGGMAMTDDVVVDEERQQAERGAKTTGAEMRQSEQDVESRQLVGEELEGGRMANDDNW